MECSTNRQWENIGFPFLKEFRLFSPFATSISYPPLSHYNRVIFILVSIFQLCFLPFRESCGLMCLFWRTKKFKCLTEDGKQYSTKKNLILNNWVNVSGLCVLTNFRFQIAFGSHFSSINYTFFVMLNTFNISYFELVWFTAVVHLLDRFKWLVLELVVQIFWPLFQSNTLTGFTRTIGWWVWLLN